MTKDQMTKYHKFHRMTMSYRDAEKYIMVGWKLLSVRNVHLKDINKDYEECCLVWDKDNTPIEPTDI